jgi:hypothetical protein
MLSMRPSFCKNLSDAAAAGLGSSEYETKMGMQTFELKAGTTVAYLIKTIDEWPGDAGPNEMQTPVTFLVRTLDKSPPAFLFGYPRITKTFYTAARFAVQLDEAATVTYIVLPSNLAVTPTADEVFEQSVRPRFQLVPTTVGSFDVPLALEVTFSNITGLKSLTTYTVWAVAEDTAGNRVAEAIAVPFETLDNQPPDLQAVITDVGTAQVTIRLQLDEAGRVYYFAVQQLGSGSATCPNGKDLKSLVQNATTEPAGTIDVPNADIDLSR